MSTRLVALFGEAEKGAFHEAYHIRTLEELEQLLGHPPDNSFGLHFAIQAILFQHDLLFFRVEEEGFSIPHYMRGLELLKSQDKAERLAAIGLPGVGDEVIIQASLSLCDRYRSLLLLKEADLYDYLTFCGG
ncbi:MAG: hypothetical protein JSR80_02770 [Verrucomicrobia bacterium]|nr:hypothetical protein [Verrucomicrobiota bacterium]